jgi:hypothetical protein
MKLDILRWSYKELTLEVTYMERDNLDRLRSEFERLYQQANFEPPQVSPKADRPEGWWQKLQRLWQKVSHFFTEESDDSPQSDPLWWQIHSWRMGAYAPLFTDETSDEAKHWLESLYQQSSTDRDR